MHSRITRRTVLAGTVLAVVVIALCGATASTSATQALPSPLSTVQKSVKGLSLKARDLRLQELTRREGGQINVYTSLSSLVLTPLSKAWAAQYPDIKLNVYRASSEDVTAKVLAERNAGTKGADVIETNGTNMLIFQHFKNVLVPYATSPYRAKIAKQYRFDAFTADRLEKFVVAWNTNLVKDPPTSFQDLTNAKWKGKLAIEPTDVDWFAALYEYFTKTKKMSTKKADAMFKAIAANSQIVNGHTAQANLLAAGQIQVIVSGHAQSIEQLQAKKAPIAFSPFVTPVVERPQGLGISYRLPHPAGGMLFYDWLLSPAAQKVMLDNGVEPARTDYNDSAFSSKPFTVKVDERPIVSNYVKWSKKFDSITRVAKG
jgi:iron(III) transport system substrate-binding protein